MLTIPELMQTFSGTGELVWIGLRPARQADMIAVCQVFADSDLGLQGDRHLGSGKRQVTLMQWEHLAVLASFSNRTVTPELLRRNLVIRGVNLLALKDRKFRLGTAVFQTTGLCHPCSKMERALGFGGYNAMRGHGGLTAQIIQSGSLRVGDLLTVMSKDFGC